MKCEGRGRRQPWSNLKHCTGISLEGLRKTQEISVRYRRCLGRDLNPALLENEAVLVTSRLLCTLKEFQQHFSRYVHTNLDFTENFYYHETKLDVSSLSLLSGELFRSHDTIKLNMVWGEDNYYHGEVEIHRELFIFAHVQFSPSTVQWSRVDILVCFRTIAKKYSKYNI